MLGGKAWNTGSREAVSWEPLPERSGGVSCGSKPPECFIVSLSFTYNTHIQRSQYGDFRDSNGKHRALLTSGTGHTPTKLALLPAQKGRAAWPRLAPGPGSPRAPERPPRAHLALRAHRGGRQVPLGSSQRAAPISPANSASVARQL